MTAWCRSALPVGVQLEVFVRVLALVSVLLLGAALAQGSISGTLFAPDTQGFVVIACYPSADDGCDESLSGVTQLAGGGGRQAFRIDGLAEGSYMLIAWQDANGNADAEENELVFLLGGDGEPVWLRPPMKGVEFRVELPAAAQIGSPPVTTQPATSTTRGALPADLVGIWQQTRASAGDYRNLTTGYEFTATSGFSAQLVIGVDGGYYMAYYSSGYQTGCAVPVSYFEQSRGAAGWEGSRLLLQPVEHRLDVNGCTNPGSYDLGTDPIVFAATVVEAFDFYGLRSYTLTLDGGPHPLELGLLHHEPLMPGYQPEQPADFVLGDVAVYREFVGTWAYSEGSRLDFYDPRTGAYYLPEFDGTGHEWLRFGETDYELARAWRDYNLEGVCKKDYVYYERGTPTMTVTEAPQSEGADIVGHLRLRAFEARLVVNIHDCEGYEQTSRYDLVPQTSYYTWRYRPETDYLVRIPEGLTLQCPWPRAEWQFMVCDEEFNAYVRR